MKLRNEWKVPVPFLITEDVAQRTYSYDFSSGSGSTWKIGLYIQKTKIAIIRVQHFYSTTSQSKFWWRYASLMEKAIHKNENQTIASKLEISAISHRQERHYRFKMHNTRWIIDFMLKNIFPCQKWTHFASWFSRPCYGLQ